MKLKCDKLNFSTFVFTYSVDKYHHHYQNHQERKSYYDEKVVGSGESIDSIKSILSLIFL